MIEDENFDNNIDGGEIIPAGNIYSQLSLGLDCEYLFDSGNFVDTLITGVNHAVIVETGMFSKFYRIFPINVEGAPDSISENQLFKLLPNDQFEYYNTKDHIIYSKAPNAIFDVTGLTARGTLVSLQINSLVEVPAGVSTTNPTQKRQFNYYRGTNYIPIDDTITPSENLLYVYNLNNPESIDIKNYYFQKRTGVSGANILGINCHAGYSGFYTDAQNYFNNIRYPIHSYIRTGQKPIKFVCLLHGIPLQITGGVSPNMNSFSVVYDLSVSMSFYSGYSRNSNYAYDGYHGTSYIHVTTNPNIYRPFLLEEYSGNAALFCALGSLASRTADVSGYIRRICDNGIVDGPYIKGSGQNNTFLIYSNGGTGFFSTGANPLVDSSPWFRYDENYYNNLGINISVSKPIAQPTIAAMTGFNICGFTSDGFHGFVYDGGTGTDPLSDVGGGWVLNNGGSNAYRIGNRLGWLSGYNWYISSHFESFAGDMITSEIEGSHRSFSIHIQSNAFNGTNYENIPVGFVGSMTEPMYGGVEHMKFFDAWFNGRTFIEAAYMGLNHVHYAIMGDPLVKFR